MVFYVFGKSDITDKITGTDHQTFIKDQFTPWMAMLTGLMLADVMGIFSTWKLLKNQKKQKK